MLGSNNPRNPKWLTYRLGKHANDTLKISFGMGMRTIAQSAIFLILARVFGVEIFGYYTAVLALASILGYLGGSGVHVLMLREVSRKPECLHQYWQSSLGALLISSPILITLYLLLAAFILPVHASWVTVILIGISELFFAPFILTGIHVYQSHERFGRTARLLMVPVVSRFCGALVFLLLYLFMRPEEPLPLWGGIYLFSAVLAALYILWLVQSDFNVSLVPRFNSIWKLMADGSRFSIGGVALRIYADIDKTMLARLASLEAAGAYSAGYRIVDLALIPINALLTTSASKFFKKGGKSINEALHYCVRLLPLPTLYAFCASMLVYACAGYIPLVLGQSFVSAVDAVRLLALLPLLSLPRGLLQTALIGADKNDGVIRILVLGAIVNITLNMIFIPLWSWKGAVISTYISELAMAFAMAYMGWYYAKRQSTAVKL